MKILEILQEDILNDETHIVRTFDIRNIENRRFMFNANKKQLILGDIKNGMNGSHSEEYFELFKTNKGFDQYIRGWVGSGRYKNGIIQFAPSIPNPTPENWKYYDDALKCLEYFIKNGNASPKTTVRGFSTKFEQKIKDIFDIKDMSLTNQ